MPEFCYWPSQSVVYFVKTTSQTFSYTIGFIYVVKKDHATVPSPNGVAYLVKTGS